MKQLRIDTQPPNDERRTASNLRLLELTELLFSTTDLEAPEDRALIRAMNILAHERLVKLIANTREPIFGFAPNIEDHWLYKRCCEDRPDLETFKDAASLIDNLDRLRLEHGWPTVDEVAEAIRKITNDQFRGSI